MFLILYPKILYTWSTYGENVIFNIINLVKFDFHVNLMQWQALCNKTYRTLALTDK